jgi:hypothetical protein
MDNQQLKYFSIRPLDEIMSEHIITATAELKKVFSILSDDVEEARCYGQNNPSHFAHRTLFRTYFSLIEGLSYQFRRVSLTYAEANPNLLTIEEIFLLKEKKCKLNKKGEADDSFDFQPLLPNILFSMRCYAKIHGATFQPDLGNHGYEAMQEFVALRNGLEHPKSIADLVQTDAQIQQAVEAAQWWKTNVLKLFQVCKEADDYWREKLS